MRGSGSTLTSIIASLLFSTSVQAFSPMLKLGRLSARSLLLRGGGGGLRPLSSASMPLSEAPNVNIKASTIHPGQLSGDLVVLPLYAAPKEESSNTAATEKSAAPTLAVLSELAKQLDGDDSSGGALAGVKVSELVSSSEFKGKAGEHVTVRLAGKQRLALLGLGTPPSEGEAGAAVDTDAASTGLGAALAAVAKDEKFPLHSMAVAVPKGFSTARVASGFMGGLYQDNRFRTGDNLVPLLKLTSLDLLLEAEEGGDGADDKSITDALSRIQGVNLCKDLVNAPANVLTPQSLAGVAATVASEHKDVFACEVLEKAEIEALGMGAFLGVAQGSVPGEGDPRFIHLTYTPPPPSDDAGAVASKNKNENKRVALIGKGLTFDSGGYNLKAGAGSMIEMMKFDMGGSAAVLGAAKAIGLLQPQGVEVHFIVAACENMISDRAMRPGDILTASNGKTIEVINTDAEGRLTMADALVFADNLPGPKLDAVVDVATLTGACMIALGDKYAGLWSSDETVAAALEEASRSSGDKVWRMPLASSEYKELTKSKIADLTNVGPRAGGAITAALFLQEFTTSPWAHVDIAGPVWSDGKNGQTGATGFGVNLLVDFVTSMGSGGQQEK